ncbi:receptor-type tyrosine-protein phosphatase C-like isoform X2 [Ostrea edulis]|uniref:receptor-type tyrosine-protein phosphatase C-like isoform X2 n=1 Tax=Ostrea edulis TaxID=37623 RepID=UPI0024AFCDF4|nr:receptor-type tyrosine-protein phosphatase C-like isoform X2 [Ostrea edulis]
MKSVHISVFYFVFLFCFPVHNKQENLALNKDAKMSPKATEEHRMTDGNRSQTENLCTHSDSKTKNFTYAIVDLGNLSNIYNITIYYGEGYVHRLKGYALYHSKEMKEGPKEWEICYKHNTSEDDPETIVSNSCKARARYLYVYQNNTSDKEKRPFLDICEIEVVGCISNQYMKGSDCVQCPGASCRECDPDGKCLDCRNGTYGDHCEQRCSESCKDNKCDLNTGKCEKCQKNKYGFNCTETCGHCDVDPKYKSSDNCDDDNGKCVEGCMPGFSGRLCTEKCTKYKYGKNCNESCSEVCVDQQCNRTSGACLRCVAGKRGELCDEECGAMSYGENCTFKCGHCLRRKCDPSDGKCMEGCDRGYHGSYCREVCVNKTFGEDCVNTCGHCINDCDPFNGSCAGGCQDGYQGTTCTERCDDGYYGSNCTETCNEHCLVSKTKCDHVTECTNGTFGKQCTLRCNRWCSGNSQTCDPMNGRCLNGCIAGYSGLHCNIIDPCDAGRYGVNCSKSCGNCFLDICSYITGECIFTEPISTYKYESERNPSSEEFKDFLLLVCVSTAALLTIMVLTGTWRVGMHYRARRGTNRRHDLFDDMAVGMSEEPFIPTFVTDTCIPIEALHSVIDTKALDNNSIFVAEFSSLPVGVIHDHETENVSRKRHSKIYMASDEGGKNSVPFGISSSDSIYASYIKNVDGKIAYIASQVVSKFNWHMVWNENVHKIVLIYDNQEHKDESVPNWPKAGHSTRSGPFLISTIQERDYAFCSLHLLKVQKDNLHFVQRDVLLFHYKNWLGEKEPTLVDLVSFYFRVIAFRTDVAKPCGPLLVQCSDGIGKTGVFIALDALFNHGLHTKMIDVPHYIQTMRQTKPNMIKSVGEYITLHRLLLEVFTSTPKPLSSQNFLLDKVDNEAVLQMFSGINTKRPTYKLCDYEQAFQNMDLVSNINALPLDRFHYSSDHAVQTKSPLFTNSITVPSYTSKNRFIVSQLPCLFNNENSTRVLKGIPCCVMILMGSREETETVISQLLDEGPMYSSFYKHRVVNKTTVSNTLCFTEAVVKSQEEATERTLSICEMSSWPTKHLNTEAYTDMLKTLTIVLESDKTSPILLLSQDGAQGCDIFCVIHNCLEQALLDDEIDLCSVIRQLQTRRPEFIATKEEFQLCLEVCRKCLSVTMTRSCEI